MEAYDAVAVEASEGRAAVEVRNVHFGQGHQQVIAIGNKLSRVSDLSVCGEFLCLDINNDKVNSCVG